MSSFMMGGMIGMVVGLNVGLFAYAILEMAKKWPTIAQWRFPLGSQLSS